ncbi:MAG: hypothetical protein HY746_00595 [Elusimicrobia bacterium]|nr:hypothetical protein [Elusimicrobiota bacterium]
MKTKKSTNLWTLMIIISFLVVVASGYMLYLRLDAHFFSGPHEIRPEPVQIDDDAEAGDEEENVAQDNPEKPPAQNPAPAKPANQLEKEKTQKAVKAMPVPPQRPMALKAAKTVFTYKNAKAKSVKIAGSFTKWKEIKMDKKGIKWETQMWILPGNYVFHYVVDGKKILDPGKPRAEIGESIVTVISKE